ncbi:cell death-inducing p53-target protein 1 homolog isoform X2 [Acanthaster planci]|uniref:Cell death-inducing p53-target protein 1 homolog isoform X2 n=1 Tax=Acanthaster planci TaxID=133434 RepID=A0A8B7YJK1_ACAPL|nr:cell death-inducing p53-target protein 1 homolog isoform X2 [Acanthaster planci]
MEETTDPSAPPPDYEASQQQQQGVVQEPMSGPETEMQPPPYLEEWKQQPIPQPGPVYGAGWPQQPIPQPAPGPAGTGWQQPAPVMQQPQSAFVTLSPGTFTALPTAMQCPHCGNSITTKTEKQVGSGVWATAAIMCFIGFFFLVCCIGLIPFCIPSLMDTVHSCPVCKKVLGTHRLM